MLDHTAFATLLANVQHPNKNRIIALFRAMNPETGNKAHAASRWLDDLTYGTEWTDSWPSQDEIDTAIRTLARYIRVFEPNPVMALFLTDPDRAEEHALRDYSYAVDEYQWRREDPFDNEGELHLETYEPIAASQPDEEQLYDARYRLGDYAIRLGAAAWRRGER